MLSTRSSKTNETTKKNKTITRNTTCVDLFSYEEIQFSCSKCHSTIDILAPKQTKIKHHKQKIKCNQCLQQWDSSFATSSSKALFHKKVCDYLGLECTIEFEDEYKYNKNYNSLKNTSSNDSESPSNEKQNMKGNHTGKNPSPLKIQNKDKKLSPLHQSKQKELTAIDWKYAALLLANTIKERIENAVKSILYTPP